MELRIVRATLADTALFNPHEETIVRTALSLARLYKVRQDGREVGVGAFLRPFREEVTRRLRPLLSEGTDPVSRALLMPHLKELKARTIETRQALERRYGSRLSPDAIDREIRHKALVLVLGGGGGTGYVYAGVMGLLEEFGLTPRLLVGTSMGAILSLFRSRANAFDKHELTAIVRELTFKKIFKVISTENRYGVPAALRLFLRGGIGKWFGIDDPTGPGGMTLRDLPIKTMITVSGIRRDKLPHPLEFYERLLKLTTGSLLNPLSMVKNVHVSMTSLIEFFTHPEIMVRLHLGSDEMTSHFDALDAAGFSSALPGVIHYDVLRADPKMHDLLGALFEQHRIARLVDGGLVDNLACRAAWRAVHKGHLGTRNAFILGLNAFSAKLTTPFWLALETLAERNVATNRPYAHLVHDFNRTLSPFEVVPNVERFHKAIELGRAALVPDVPFLTRMLAPLPPLN